MANGSPEISLVYPMYNERGSIAQALAHGVTVLSSVTPDWEIVVVDDGSDDGSGAVVERLALESARVRVISHRSNEGLGKTLRDGFSAAFGQVVLYSDSDLPYDLSILKDALPLLEKADLVAGYRLNRRETFLRLAYSRVYNLMIKALFGLPVRDVNFSFKLLKRRVLEDIRLESKGSFIDAEILIKARGAGFALAEIGIVYTHRRHGVSKLSSIPTIIEMVGEMCRQWRLTAYRPWAGYRVAGLRDRLHTAYRWMSCPFEFLERLVPVEGRILDIGCGHGLFAHWLAARSSRREVVGWDPDARKIALARKHLPAIANLRFLSDPALPAVASPALSAVTLVDVLQHLSSEEKNDLLRRCRESLAPGGFLLIKEIDTRPAWKFAWTFAQEALALRLGLTVAPSDRGSLHFEAAERYRQLLESLGFDVRVLRPKTRLPYPHVVIAGTKTR